MYNRYIPQPDGSYRRSRIQETPPTADRPQKTKTDPEPTQQHPAEDHPEQPNPSSGQKKRPSAHARAPQPIRQNSSQRAARQQNRGESKETGLGDFLRQLLPKDFDTEDLLIIVLLLLMSGDRKERDNSAILTLALYLFM